ncbi:hypothetical protein CRUP_037732 [Coryphaenoides rupestris]|nr:hypothetical protein CRUP_037732 [Coryphaenoides rupestris]
MPSPQRRVFAARLGEAAPPTRLEEDPCQTSPCLHGGRCLQEGDSYSCYCPQGFSGESCEIGESRAADRPRGQTAQPRSNLTSTARRGDEEHWWLQQRQQQQQQQQL